MIEIGFFTWLIYAMGATPIWTAILGIFCGALLSVVFIYILCVSLRLTDFKLNKLE